MRRQGNSEQQRQASACALTIQQVAQITGLSAHTLRYYERARLMKQPVERNQAGYRRYTWQDVDWIGFLKRLRATGMPIRQIQRYTALIAQGDQTAFERLQLLQQHQQRVEAHHLEIEQHLAAIAEKIGCYEREYPHLHAESEAPLLTAQPNVSKDGEGIEHGAT
jgi:DNA-binding transcriptional MerR regulator